MKPIPWALLVVSSLLVGCEPTAVSPSVARLARPVAKTEVVAQVQPPTPVGRPAGNFDEAQRTEAPRYSARKAIAPATAAKIPPVLLTSQHKQWCLVNVGEPLPTLSLPRLGGQTTDISSLLGKQATVILFWQPDRWMARAALADLQREVADKFDEQKVAVAGIAVHHATGDIQNALNKAGAKFPQLLDTDGKAFATVGTGALPRIYVLDPAGKIVWFDIEYSEATRRELRQTLVLLASVKDAETPQADSLGQPK